MDGETAKNRILLAYLKELYPGIEVLDTFNWKKSVYTLIQIIRCLFLRDVTIFVSASTNSVYKFSKLSYTLGSPGTYFYFVIGNTILNQINQGKMQIKYLQKYRRIFVEGKRTKEALIGHGLKNVSYLPNFKKIYPISVEYRLSQIRELGKIHFVFLSRIMEEKGVTDIFRAMNILNDLGLKQKYDVTFYGAENAEYKTYFADQIVEISNALYGGFLNLQSQSGYETLAKYHLMLFPTYWHGEGFPGVIVDSFVAGVPVVASDWNLNAEIIQNNFNGLLIEPRNVNSLVDAMSYFISEPEEIGKLSMNCLMIADQYDYRKVLVELNDYL